MSIQHGAKGQPRVADVCLELTGRFPRGQLGDRAQRVDGAPPGESLGVDSHAAELCIGAQESSGESSAHMASDGTHGGRAAEGWVGEHQGGEAEVVVRVGDDGGGPVEDGPAVAVDEEIEGVQVAVADDSGRWCAVGQGSGGCGEVDTADDRCLFGDTCEIGVDVGAGMVVGEVWPVDGAEVEVGSGSGEKVW